jgi:sugar phosphate isomerase/epimerase
MEPEEALVLAQKLGYWAIGIRLAPMVPGGHFSPLSQNVDRLRSTAARMRETGIKVLEVEGVRLDEAFRPGCFDKELVIAAELGAKVISVVGDDPEQLRLEDSFAGLCDAAAPYGLEVALEFMPYSRVHDADVAMRILRRASRRNARIAFDFLHASRTGMTRADLLSIPQRLLSYAQLCDAPAQIPTTREALIHTARYERLLPGTGGIDIRGLTDALPANLPLCVEIPNSLQMGLLGPEEWARRALSATRQALEC